MSGSGLTSRERMHRMLERRDHDRIPRSDGYWPETIARWQEEGLAGDEDIVYGLLGRDVDGVCWSWPVPYPGRREVLEEDARTELVLGTMGNRERVWKNKSGTPEHVAFGCRTREDWEREYKPALLRSGLSIDADETTRKLSALRRKQMFATLSGIESFEAMRQLVGDEVLLMAMAEDPEWVQDMSRTYADLILQDFEGVLATGADPDAVWVFGDVGFNHGPFFSPGMYRAILWSDHKRLRDWAHAHGMKFIYHTDGDVRPLLDHFVEAGFDCIQPMEAKAGMDLRELAPRYGERLSFFGNINMVIVARGNPEEIEAEVRSKLEAGMANHGYAYYSDHSVPPLVSWESYRLIISLLDRYGTYD